MLRSSHTLCVMIRRRSFGTGNKLKYFENTCGAFTVRQLPLLRDNYSYVVRHAESQETFCVDPPESAPIVRALEEWNWKLDFILNTHHHDDHTGGNLKLKSATGAIIVGSELGRARIPGIDRGFKNGDEFELPKSGVKATIMDLQGHTRDHIGFHFPDQKVVFVGDTLFAMGCGRNFEGPLVRLWQSLQRLQDLPGDTLVFCGHEYTEDNGRFLLDHGPGRYKLRIAERMKRVEAARAERLPTVPSLLSEELLTNPFLTRSMEEFIILRTVKDAWNKGVDLGTTRPSTATVLPDAPRIDGAEYADSQPSKLYTLKK